MLSLPHHKLRSREKFSLKAFVRLVSYSISRLAATIQLQLAALRGTHSSDGT